MGKYLIVRSSLAALLVCMVSMFIVAAGTIADTGAKNNGVESKANAAPSDKNNGVRRGIDTAAIIPTGSRVKAIVDYPSGSDCVRTGYTGTLVCYDPDDPEFPYLVDWDNACGYEQCQVCGVCATNGWWVGFGEIQEVGGGGISGCVEVNGVAVTNRRVILKQTGEVNKRTTTGSDGCYQFTNPAPGKRFTVTIHGRVPQ